MLSLLLVAAQAFAAPETPALETKPVEPLAVAEINKSQLHIKFHSGGCGDQKDVPVTYAVKLRKSTIRDTPADLSEATPIKRMIDIEYDVTALVTQPQTNCAKAFVVERTVDLMMLARNNHDMDFAQPDTGYNVSFQLTNKAGGSASVINWPKN